MWKFKLTPLSPSLSLLTRPVFFTRKAASAFMRVKNCIWYYSGCPCPSPSSPVTSSTPIFYAIKRSSPHPHLCMYVHPWTNNNDIKTSVILLWKITVLLSAIFIAHSVLRFKILLRCLHILPPNHLRTFWDAYLGSTVQYVVFVCSFFLLFYYYYSDHPRRKLVSLTICLGKSLTFFGPQLWVKFYVLRQSKNSN